MAPKEISTMLVLAMRTPMVPTFTVTLIDGRSFSGFPCGQRDPGTPGETFLFMRPTGNQAVVTLSLIRAVTRDD